jgi:hypothetical protein
LIKMYRPDGPFCKKCGMEGHAQSLCPDRPCGYCRQEGHIIETVHGALSALIAD